MVTYIYTYVVTIFLMISVRVFKSGFIFHSVGIRQNWATEKLRGEGQQMSELAGCQRGIAKLPRWST